MNLSSLFKTAAFLLFAGCLFFPLAGCGASDTNPGVDDSGVQDDEVFKETEEYVEGEEGI